MSCQDPRRHRRRRQLRQLAGPGQSSTTATPTRPSRSPGLMHVELGGYHVGDVEFVAAFDVDAAKVGTRPGQGHLLRAEQHHPLRRRRRARRDRPARPDLRRPRQVLPRDHRGVARRAGRRGRRPARGQGADVLVSYLPVGSEEAQKHYAQAAIDAKVGVRQRHPGVHRLRPRVGPEVHRRRRADRRRRHQEPGRRHHRPPHPRPPVRGPGHGARPHLPAQRRRQHGLQEHARARAPGVQEDLQDPVGHQPDRATASTPTTSTSARPTTSPWLDDRKWAYIRMEGRNFGDVPLNLELKLEVWDSPNSAGVIIDAVRCAKLALDRGIGGPLLGPSAYFMKSPPVQYHDDVAARWSRSSPPASRSLSAARPTGRASSGRIATCLPTTPRPGTTTPHLSGRRSRCRPTSPPTVPTSRRGRAAPARETSRASGSSISAAAVASARWRSPRPAPPPSASTSRTSSWRSPGNWPRQEEVRVELRQGDVADLAFLRADSIDVAFSAYAFDDVEDLARVFRQVHRVLKVGGPAGLQRPPSGLDDDRRRARAARGRWPRPSGRDRQHRAGRAPVVLRPPAHQSTSATG